MPSPLALAKRAVRAKTIAKKAAVKKQVDKIYRKKAANNQKNIQKMLAKKAAAAAENDDATPADAEKKKKRPSKKLKKTSLSASLNTKPTMASKIKTALLKKNGLSPIRKPKKLISTSKNAKRLHAKKSWSKVKVHARVAAKLKSTVKKAKAAQKK